MVVEIRKARIPLTVEKKMGGDLNYQASTEGPDGNRIEMILMMPNAAQSMRSGLWHAGSGRRRTAPLLE